MSPFPEYRRIYPVIRALVLALIVAAGAGMIRHGRRAGWQSTGFSAEAGAFGDIGAPARASPGSGYRGTLTFARDGAGDPFDPQVIVDLDLGTDQLAVRFDGFDPHRTRTGETAFLQRLTPGYVADYGVVAADARGVPGPPLYVCKSFSFGANRICHAPRLSPNGQLVAFGTAAGGGSVCADQYGTRWADYIIVRNRRGAEAARFEGYSYADWLPDGRLLMTGSPCRNAGVWIVDQSLRTPTRVDGGQVATPAAVPAVSPDGKRVALVWNNQLWAMSLDGGHELTQLTRLEKPVSAAAWSPDGGALAALMWDVTMPVRSLLLFRPDDPKSVVVKPVPFYPFGPISWR